MKRIRITACVLFSAICLTSCGGEDLGKGTHELQVSASVLKWKGYSLRYTSITPSGYEASISRW